MEAILLVLVMICALLALAGAVVALRSYLRFRRARLDFQQRLSEGLASVTERAGELQENVDAVSARAESLPVQISELQSSLMKLQFLARTLVTSLRQAQRILSYTRIRTSGSEYIADIAQKRASGFLQKLR